MVPHHNNRQSPFRLKKLLSLKKFGEFGKPSQEGSQSQPVGTPNSFVSSGCLQPVSQQTISPPQIPSRVALETNTKAKRNKDKTRN